MPISPKVSESLKELGHDSIHAFELGLDRAADIELMQWAIHDDRIIISMDLDFGMLLARSKERKPGVILFRINTPTSNRFTAYLKHLIATYPPEILNHSIVIVEDVRVRIRELPL